MNSTAASPDSRPAFHSVTSWSVTLLASSLGDIVAFDLTGGTPLWLLWAKITLPGALIVLSSLWKSARSLRPYLIMLLAISVLTRAQSWLLDRPAWIAWQRRQSFTGAALTLQAIEMIVALVLIGVPFLLRKRREALFLVRGDVDAVAWPVRWLGQKVPSSLWSFGLVFTAVVVVAQVFMFIVPLAPSADTARRLLPLIPAILLIASSNGFNEEIILRAAPVAASR